MVYTATVKLPSKPTIESISPSSVVQNTNDTLITIHGANLQSTYSVYVDMGNGGSTEQCTSLTVISDSELTCVLPAFANTGDYVLVLDAQGGETTSTIKVTAPKPQVSSITPNEFQTGASKREVITLTGQHLDQVQAVFIDFNKNGKQDDGEECLELSIVSNTEITCVRPGGDTEGTFTVYVTSSDYGAIASGTVKYIRIEAPSITRVNPNQFAINSSPGPITISGSNLQYVTSAFVDLNENQSMDDWEECTIYSTSYSQISCYMPESNITGQFTLYVVSPGGKDTIYPITYI